MLHKDRLPKHLAIIMDGNGRWAKAKGMPRTFGHEQGVKTVRATVEHCVSLGIEYLTLYTFSTENWNRPKFEIDLLMKLLIRSLKKELKTFETNNIRLNAIGDLSALPKKAVQELQEVIEKTRNNSGMTLSLALSYGSREELIQAVISPDSIDETIINTHLYTHDLPEVDLLVRTSGEHRISNFLLWQIAYAELYFISACWPDFSKAHLESTLANYQNRERRFGKTSEQLSK